MAEVIEKSDKEKAIEALNKRPASFRWTINGTTFDKAGLIKEVEAESEVVISLAKGLGNPEAEGSSNQLGKRYECLICGTVVLATKAGAGRASCCGQSMEMQVPKPLPSSD